MFKPFITLATVLFTLHSPLTQAESANTSFNWDNWANAVNSNPCRWFNEAQLTSMLGEGVTSSAKESANSSSCKFTSADGNLLLTASVRSYPSSSDLLHEIRAQKNQIEQYDSQRFSYVPTTNQAVTAILREDRLWLSMYANSKKESAFIHLSGHASIHQSAKEKTERKTRVLEFADAVFAKFSF